LNVPFTKELIRKAQDLQEDIKRKIIDTLKSADSNQDGKLTKDELIQFYTL
jgi:Ca2+-binding EF-hand superfamily protein